MIRFLEFLESGGAVFIVLAGMTFVFIFMVLARLLFLERGFAPWVQERLGGGRLSAEEERALTRAGARKVEFGFMFLQSLVAAAPLLGLLGTVSGMMDVFYIMAGASNAKAMAAGMARATLPTMAGMALALVGLFCLALLRRRQAAARARLQVTLKETQDAAMAIR